MGVGVLESFGFVVGVGEGRKEVWGRVNTFLASWNPTCPVAMEAFLCKFDQGV